MVLVEKYFQLNIQLSMSSHGQVFAFIHKLNLKVEKVSNFSFVTAGRVNEAGSS